MRRFSSAKPRMVFVLSLVLAMGSALLALVTFRVTGLGTDFEVYWVGARVFLGLEDSPGLYSGGLPGTFSAVHPEGLDFTYPPFAVLIFAPMALLPYKLALAAHLAGIFAVTALISHVVINRCFPQLEGWARWTVVILCGVALLLSAPWLSTLKYGQINHLIIALVLADVFLMRRGRGLLVGIAAGIKLTPLFFLVYFVAKRDWKGAWLTLAGFGATVGIMFALTPGLAVEFWTRAVMDTGRVGETAHASNVSLRGFLARLGFEGDAGNILWLALSALVAAGALLTVHRLRATGDIATSVSVTALAMLLVSPMSWLHHWVWIALVLAVFVRDSLASSNRALGLGLTTVSALAFYAPWRLLAPLADLRVLCAIALILVWATMSKALRPLGTGADSLRAGPPLVSR